MRADHPGSSKNMGIHNLKNNVILIDSGNRSCSVLRVLHLKLFYVVFSAFLTNNRN